ncbi:hypothetical protein HNR46_001571 [Haloferula luteola]|uniref:DUF374 domain-containing protein n=1 Tax=Haloferula luteola TaxID=595692 RepID=A0A840V017_9BACT|nr:lysophospholipid acyltransferase family protein [Haloferula luteola]MBB5351335.1 hypothetical protein [Haloferula luteola]
MGDQSEIRESRKATLLGTAAGWLMRVWCTTLRYEIEDRAGVAAMARPVVLAMWHNRIFAVPEAWDALVHGRRRAVVLTSASHDGAMLARAVGVFGIGSVRGSSSRRGVAALVALRRALREGWDCCVTPDGPRGPRYHLQAGVVKLAQTTGAPLVPIHVRFSSAWRLKSWDRFVIPKPFSKVRVVFDAALAVDPGLGEDGFENRRAEIEAVLRSGVDDFNPEA